MKKVILSFAIIVFMLTGCESESNLDLLKEETLETFIEIDFSSFELNDVEHLIYYNDYEDYEYDEVIGFDEDFISNIVSMSENFSDYDYSYGGVLSIIGGEMPSLTMSFENGNETIEVVFYRGNNEGDIYRSVLFIYDNGIDDIICIGFSNAFQTEISNIYNLLNL